MGNGKSASENSTDDKQIYRLECCKGVCDAGSRQSQNDEKLEAILFSDLGSDRISEPSDNGDKISQINIPNYQQKQELVVVKLAGQHRQVELQTQYQQMEVRYPVIKLAMNDKVSKYLQQVDPSFHKEQSKPKATSWKLTHTGFYYKQIYDAQEIIIVTETQFFKGQVIPGTMVPHKEGMYISNQGVYAGAFQKGLADGRGKFIAEKFRYQGDWKNGQIVEGTLETKQFKFRGKFQSIYPSKGTIFFKKSGIQYNGSFIEGKFQDEQACYDCDEYNYNGGFKKGLRYGYGQLKEKAIGKNKAPRMIKGIWRYDKLEKEKKKEAEKSRIEERV